MPAAGAVNGVPVSLSCAADSCGPSAAPSGPPAMLTCPSAPITSTRNCVGQRLGTAAVAWLELLPLHDAARDLAKSRSWVSVLESR